MTSLVFLLLLLFRATIGRQFIDVNDILNVDYMPGSLLLLESASEDKPVDQNVTVKHVVQLSKTGGSIKEAYKTMGYHRKKMNEYLCRNFVADQILSDMSLTRMRRRLGTAVSLKHPATDDSPNPGRNKVDVAALRNSLLFDEGSSNYKQWLRNSATLEDIYRRYEQMEDRQDDHQPEEDDADQDREEYDGEVSGYMVQQPHGAHGPHGPHRGAPPKVGYGHAEASGFPAGSAHSAYGGSDHGGGFDYAPQHVHYHHDYEESQGKGEKDIVLSELFEIALTAIAFLSFGCFVLQVIMCITMSQTQTTTTIMAITMMPMMMTMPPMGDDGDGDGDGDSDDGAEPTRIRYKRSTPLYGNLIVNDLARRVLLSIESALVTEEDDGNCLRRSLCENNKYSRSLTSNQKIWMPVWSFAMSWLTGRLNSRVPPATAMLDSLKASILGLGNANCKMIYYNCDLNKLREHRRRRRRKRYAGDDD